MGVGKENFTKEKEEVFLEKAKNGFCAAFWVGNQKENARDYVGTVRFGYYTMAQGKGGGDFQFLIY